MQIRFDLHHSNFPDSKDTTMNLNISHTCRVAVAALLLLCPLTLLAEEDAAVRVFIFAGQSNMVGSDSKVADVDLYPPFKGAAGAQPDVRFSYCIGRENKFRSNGWVDLQPVNNVVGPELSFARKVAANSAAPIAIIKCAAGGTHLGGDWNPDDPQGFKMYPLALELIRSSLAELDRQGVAYRIEGFMWHQGENDMFNEDYMANYGKNLANFLASWRRDLNSPNLKFYIGELSTKTIWGMDLRPRMYAISLGQKQVTAADPLAKYVRTSHDGVEIGGGAGLHYHYGTLGQLEHGVNYADAYLSSLGVSKKEPRSLKRWPYAKASKVQLFVMAGHRNMEGETAFVQQLKGFRDDLLLENQSIAFKYSIGGGFKTSEDWEPLGAVGFYDTFGPELSFAAAIGQAAAERGGNVAIAKFTHSGSQMNDWTPEGSMAKDRHLYPAFVSFIQESIKELKGKGHDVELAGIFYHVGENEMSMHPYRKAAAGWLKSTIQQSRLDLQMPDLRWYVSQQPPTDHESVNSIDVTGDIAKLAEADSQLIHIQAFGLPVQPRQLVLDTAGIVRLGELIAERFLQQE